MLKWQKKIITKRIWKKRDYIGYVLAMATTNLLKENQGLLKRSILAKYDEERLEGPQQSVRCFYYFWVMLTVS
jgi:hypothetical protein